MGCNCNEIDPCTSTPCAEGDTTCNCIQKDMSTDCVLYTGDDLACSGITKNTILTNVIQQLDTFICNIRDEIIQYLTLINIGGGAEVYKGISGIGNKEIRTIVSEDLTLLDVIENADTIGIKAGTHRLELSGQVLSLIVNTDQGDSTLATIDLEPIDNYLVDVNYNHNVGPGVGPFTLDFEMRNGVTFDTSLELLNNHLESVAYNSTTNNFEFTITDGTVFTADLSAALADAQVQSDYLESNSSDSAFIQNKNPEKTEVLGVAGNYDVLDSDLNYVIEIDNGANDVTINFNTVTATSNFYVGFVQKGTGNVTFIGADIIPLDLTNELYGQGHVCALDIINGTKYLKGQLKFA